MHTQVHTCGPRIVGSLIAGLFALAAGVACAAPAAPAGAPQPAAPAQAPASAPKPAAPAQAPASAPKPAAPAPAEVITLKYGGSEALDNPLTEMQRVFAKRVEELSNGRIKVQVFPTNQLGPQTSQVDQMKVGTLQSMFGSLAYVGSYVPQVNVISLPYLFKSDAQAFAIMDGAFGEKLAKLAETKGEIKILSYPKLGFLAVGSSKPQAIAKLEDLKGFKLRVLPAKIHVRSFELLGANPVAMDYAEVPSALQTKVIDGAEFGLATWWRAKHYELVKHITLTNRTYDWLGHYINKKFFDSLPPDLQKAIETASRDATAWQRDTWTKSEKEAMTSITQRGVQIIELPDAERARFVEATKGVDREFEKDFGADLIKELRDLAAR